MNSLPTCVTGQTDTARMTAASAMVSVLALSTARMTGPVDGDQRSVQRVLGFGNDAAAYEDHHQRRHQRHREEGRRCHREGLGKGEWSEQSPFLRFQREDRQERHRDDEQREEQGRSDLGCRFNQNRDARLIRAARARGACARSRS